ncbi:MAG: hypothetical protein E6J90_16140 [Deltaproteobacteria bacterium]|nr:MAG: hypothetical protein E6J90_16140 [Deltaproteobacteria bacterium]
MNEAIDHFKWWLQMRATGCIFAASLAKVGWIAYEPYSDTPQVDDLNTNLDLYGARGLTAIVLLPFIRTEAGLVDVLSGLRAGSQRWKLRARGQLNVLAAELAQR